MTRVSGIAMSTAKAMPTPLASAATGMTRTTGMPYRHIPELLEEATRP